MQSESVNTIIIQKQSIKKIEAQWHVEIACKWDLSIFCERLVALAGYSLRMFGDHAIYRDDMKLNYFILRLFCFVQLDHYEVSVPTLTPF